MFGIPIGELAILAAAIAGGGVLTGILAGLFGIGGGGVIVPVLYEVFRALGVSEDIRMQLCIGTSLAIIVPTTFRSYFTHRAEGIGLHEVVRQWTVPAIAGVATGAAVAAVAPAAVFKVAFAVIASVIAAKLLFGRESWRIADDLPRGPRMLLFGYLIGLSLVAHGGERRIDVEHHHDALRQDRSTPRSRPPRGSGCRSRSPAPSGSCSPACRTRA